MRDDRFWSNSAKFVGENLDPCRTTVELQSVMSHVMPSLVGNTIVRSAKPLPEVPAELHKTKVALINGKPLKGVVRNGSMDDSGLNVGHRDELPTRRDNDWLYIKLRYSPRRK